MINRQAEIRKIFKNAKQKIHIPNHLEYEAALESEYERLLSLFDMPFAEELFSQHSLKLELISEAKTLAEMTASIDSFIAIVEFYSENHRLFSNIIKEPFFQVFLMEKDEMLCWKELMQHSFKKLNYNQAKLLVLDSLTRFTSKPVEVEQDQLTLAPRPHCK